MSHWYLPYSQIRSLIVCFVHSFAHWNWYTAFKQKINGLMRRLWQQTFIFGLCWEEQKWWFHLTTFIIQQTQRTQHFSLDFVLRCRQQTLIHSCSIMNTFHVNQLDPYACGYILQQNEEVYLLHFRRLCQQRKVGVLSELFARPIILPKQFWHELYSVVFCASLYINIMFLFVWQIEKAMFFYKSYLDTKQQERHFTCLPAFNITNCMKEIYLLSRKFISQLLGYQMRATEPRHENHLSF